MSRLHDAVKTRDTAAAKLLLDQGAVAYSEVDLPVPVPVPGSG